MIGTFYWILAVDNVTTRPVILGPYGTEQEATQIGLSKIGTGFEVVPLSTRNTARATKILKHRRFMATERLYEAVKRAQHKV